MALRRARSRPGSRPARRVTGIAGRALGVTLAITLGGCAPVDAWRSLTGVDKNDPDPQSAPFTGNLAAGEATPYPNLASVPPPPTRATTTAERQKLTQSLIADRNSAEPASATPRLAPAAAAKPTPNPATPPPAASAEVMALPAPAPVPGAAAAPPAPATASPPAAAAAAQAPSAPGRTASNATPSGRRKAGEPPEPGPQDSTLEMPQLRSVPEPEAARPAPPAPALAAVPWPAAVAEPLPASVANMMPEPAPPVPVLDPVAPPPSAVKPESQRKPELQRKPDSQRKTAATTVATLDIPGAAAGTVPAVADRAQIERVAGLYRDSPGTVRVVGYAAGPAGGGAVGAVGGDPLASYHAALERAQTVAKALTEAGIPASKIQTEASPAGGARAPGRVEILFAQ